MNLLEPLLKPTDGAAGAHQPCMQGAFDVLQRAVNNGEIPGAVALVAHRGRVLLHAALGHAEKTPNVRAMTVDTVFDVASVTKPVFALAVMKAVEEGLIALDEPVADFLPPFRRERWNRITVRQLLSHTSGIPGQVRLYRHASDRQSLVEAIYELPLVYVPGEGVVYSSQGFIVLDELLTHIVGDWESFLLDEMMTPLGLSETCFNPPEDWKPRIAATENCPWRGRVVVGEVHDENAQVMGGVAGHAGLFSTAWDLAVIGQMMLNEGVYNGRRVLAASTVRAMARVQRPDLAPVRCLGRQGQDREASPAGDLLSPRAYGHTGFTGTSLWIDPEQQLVVVLLTNRVHPSRENTSIFKVRPRFHNAVCAGLHLQEE